jgi:hypothetical protein
MSFNIKQHDRSPDYTSALEAPAGSPVDLTGCTVKLLMTLDGATSATVNASATVDSPSTAGLVRYSWGPTDTSTAGLYRAEFEVTFAGGIKRTFPENDYLYVNILPDLG